MSGTVSTRWYFSDWMSDESVRACSLAARGLWMDLLCIAAANKGHDHGFVMVAGKGLSHEQIARRVGTSAEEVSRLLDELHENGVSSRDRRGIVYCRRMVRAEKNRGNGRLGGEIKARNERLKSEIKGGSDRLDAGDKPLDTKENPNSAGEKPCPLIPDPDPEPKEESPSETPRALAWPSDYRERFWQSYPRKTEKKAALAKLDALRRDGKVPWEDFAAGVARYAAHVSGTEERYIKHPTTWLNRGCWDDEHKGETANGAGRNGGGKRGDGGGGYRSFAAFAVAKARQAGEVERGSPGGARSADGSGDPEDADLFPPR